MSKRSYHLGPMDPSGELLDGPGPSKRRALSLLEAIRQDFRRDTGELLRRGNGFIYQFGKDTYYSPNCNRPDVRVPAKLDTSTSPSIDALKPATTSSGVLFGRDFDIDTFLQPQWWTASQGYFAFTPRVLDSTTPSFRPVRYRPLVNRLEKSEDFYVDRIMLGRWKDIEDNLTSAIRKLRSLVSLSMVLPLPPCAQVDGAKFRSKRQAVLKVERAQGWFNVWVGALGYAIAVFGAVADKAKEVRIQADLPAWMEVLLSTTDTSQALDEVFVSDVSRVVAQYDGSIARVGAFVELPSTPNEDMVSIDWLLSINVPVWWAWGPREERIAREYPVFNRYRPPANALCVVGEPHAMDSDPRMNVATSSNIPSQSVVSSPAEHIPSTVNSATSGPPRARFEQRPSPSSEQLSIWEKARSLRMGYRANHLAKETTQQRQRREATEKNPPTRANKVKYWLWSLDPTSSVYKPELLDKEEAQEMFSSESNYSRQQAEYDSIGCQWHIAEFLGVPTDVQLARMAEEAADYHATPYELEYLRLRVWYGLEDIPSETPSQMKDRLAAESTSATNDGGAVNATLPSSEQMDVDTAPIDLVDDSVAGQALEHAQSENDSNVAALDTEATSDPLQDTQQSAALRSRTESTAYLLCGYVVPDPLPNDDSPFDSKGSAAVSRIMGIINTLSPKGNYWSTDSGKSLARFGSMIMQKPPSSDPHFHLWDISPSSRVPITTRHRFQLLQCLRGRRETTVTTWDNVRGTTSTTALVDTRVTWINVPSEGGWFLGTTSSAVALQICRTDDSLSTTDVAYDLLCRGFRIHTLHRLAASWRSPTVYCPPSSSTSTLSRYRSSGHNWSERDYESWLASVKIFMRSSRGRAAILRGGIVWRITVQLLLPELVLLGPSLRAIRGEGFIIRDETGRHFVDDELTQEEVDLICGVHYLYIVGEQKKIREPVTGGRPYTWNRQAPQEKTRREPQEQMQRVSYFPPEDLWLRRFGTAAGWSEDADHWYRQTEDALRKKNFKPRTRCRQGSGYLLGFGGSNVVRPIPVSRGSVQDDRIIKFPSKMACGGDSYKAVQNQRGDLE